jgi:hypothetical protein
MDISEFSKCQGLSLRSLDFPVRGFSFPPPTYPRTAFTPRTKNDGLSDSNRNRSS